MWLLALMTLRAGREVDRRWLAGQLWPDSAEELALYNLRRYLTILRDLLGAEAGRIEAPSPRTVRLNLEGAFADVAYQDRSATLEPGDLLLVYTDGITDARDPSGAFFGEDRLRELVIDGEPMLLHHQAAVRFLPEAFRALAPIPAAAEDSV